MRKAHTRVASEAGLPEEDTALHANKRKRSDNFGSNAHECMTSELHNLALTEALQKEQAIVETPTEPMESENILPKHVVFEDGSTDEVEGGEQHAEAKVPRFQLTVDLSSIRSFQPRILHGLSQPPVSDHHQDAYDDAHGSVAAGTNRAIVPYALQSLSHQPLYNTAADAHTTTGSSVSAHPAQPTQNQSSDVSAMDVEPAG